ncbi:hypothetical protein DLM86_01980 [Paenibacillus flagellatus]|uniref:Uncharacterized protein n=1 Tax=Paenibacillus flagellatus TaxID=2211139 RepID=A0A2V5KCA9_9BACL|nr:hypothetical protein DLM86_01980 [Paenibacillus flagellatus]
MPPFSSPFRSPFAFPPPFPSPSTGPFRSLCRSTVPFRFSASLTSALVPSCPSCPPFPSGSVAAASLRIAISSGSTAPWRTRSQ